MDEIDAVTSEIRLLFLRLREAMRLEALKRGPKGLENRSDPGFCVAYRRAIDAHGELYRMFRLGFKGRPALALLAAREAFARACGELRLAPSEVLKCNEMEDFEAWSQLDRLIW